MRPEVLISVRAIETNSLHEDIFATAIRFKARRRRMSTPIILGIHVLPGNLDILAY